MPFAASQIYALGVWDAPANVVVELSMIKLWISIETLEPRR
ncbi:hypothetical protein SAMN05444358_10643 [Ruegeria halocynthiae]|uniref:Uncharacterized protein n=1 Tax=Ruegeria halocynthiae TaxID=985054 RepID=A0A1H3BXA9_9RHOB|nr:hypothetical protein SAMN05444358_10643 [Ruegeria halocynthiae]